MNVSLIAAKKLIKIKIWRNGIKASQTQINSFNIAVPMGWIISLLFLSHISTLSVINVATAFFDPVGCVSDVTRPINWKLSVKHNCAKDFLRSLKRENPRRDSNRSPLWTIFTRRVLYLQTSRPRLQKGLSNGRKI